jgi:multidrug resistance efflux pump
MSGDLFDGHKPTAPSSINPPGPGMPVSQSPKSKGTPLILILAILLILLVGAGIGYRYWYFETHYVTTDNARVTGELIQVGALNAGRVENILVDVGSKVSKEELLAIINIPSVASVAQGTAKMGYANTDDLRVEVRAPISGEIIARQASIGDTIAAGQAMLVVVNPAELWISANIEETKISRVRKGQAVEVRVDALDRTFKGVVDTITPATTATFSLLPQQNGSGNFTKITQLLPVKIRVNTEGEILPLGGSVNVRIEVRPPQRRLPAWIP